MGKLFDSDGYMVIPQKKEKIQKKSNKCLVVKQCFCPNGHNMIWDNAKFDGHSGIRIIIETPDNKRGELLLSPIYGDSTKVTIGTTLKDGIKVRMRCPICEVELPVLKPCDYCDTGEFIAISLKNPFDYRDAIGICNIVGCHNSTFIAAGELISNDLEKISAVPGFDIDDD